MQARINQYFDKKSSPAPLAVLRILFGLLMLFSIVRFWYHGWIEKLYLEPSFHFKYYGFEWVQVPGNWTYALFMVCGISTLGFAAGYRYKLSAIVFFLSFTYIELMDKTTYLNHYYFISVLSFLMIWLPANATFSLDNVAGRTPEAKTVPQWCIDTIKVMLAIVYLYAGMAKLNYDWMVEAMPLSIWLSSKTEMPLIGSLLDETWVHYAFSWGGAIYDLLVVFLLLYKPTRWLGFTAVILFHVLTRILFPIGMFPFIMIAGTLIFFDPSFHQKVLDCLSAWFGYKKDNYSTVAHQHVGQTSRRVIIFVLILQILIPWRYLLYPGNLFWTEEGYRYSWRVMLMEKTGSATFKIVDGKTGKRFFVQNNDFLNSLQEKQMATQPDFILEYAHYLGNHFSQQGHQNVEVYVESYASLNGRMNQQFINPTVDLMKVKEGFLHKDWIIALNE